MIASLVMWNKKHCVSSPIQNSVCETRHPSSFTFSGTFNWKIHESLHVVSTLEMQLPENITFVITFSDMLYYFVILQFMVKKKKKSKCILIQKNLIICFETYLDKCDSIIIQSNFHKLIFKTGKKSKFIFFFSFPDSKPKSTLLLKEIHHVSAKLFEPCLLWSVTQ